jgi:hypothetical protein
MSPRHMMGPCLVVQTIRGLTSDQHAGRFLIKADTASTLLLSQWLLERSSCHAMGRTVYKNTSNTPHTTHTKRLIPPPVKVNQLHLNCGTFHAISKAATGRPRGRTLLLLEYKILQIGTGQLQPTGGPHSSLKTRLRAARVHICIAK